MEGVSFWGKFDNGAGPRKFIFQHARYNEEDLFSNRMYDRKKKRHKGVESCFFSFCLSVPFTPWQEIRDIITWTKGKNPFIYGSRTRKKKREEAAIVNNGGRLTCRNFTYLRLFVFSPGLFFTAVTPAGAGPATWKKGFSRGGGFQDLRIKPRREKG